MKSDGGGRRLLKNFENNIRACIFNISHLIINILKAVILAKQLEFNLVLDDMATL